MAMAEEMKPSKAWLPNPLCCSRTDRTIDMQNTRFTMATATAHVTLNDTWAATTDG
jgi:hypothetical protein